MINEGTILLVPDIGCHGSDRGKLPNLFEWWRVRRSCPTTNWENGLTSHPLPMWRMSLQVISVQRALMKRPVATRMKSQHRRKRKKPWHENGTFHPEGHILFLQVTWRCGRFNGGRCLSTFIQALQLPFVSRFLRQLAKPRCIHNVNHCHTCDLEHCAVHR